MSNYSKLSSKETPPDLLDLGETTQAVKAARDKKKFALYSKKQLNAIKESGNTERYDEMIEHNKSMREELMDQQASAMFANDSDPRRVELVNLHLQDEKTNLRELNRRLSEVGPKKEKKAVLNEIKKVKFKILILKSQIPPTPIRDFFGFGLRKSRKMSHSNKKKARTQRKRSFGKTKKHNKKSHHKKSRKH